MTGISEHEKRVMVAEVLAGMLAFNDGFLNQLRWGGYDADEERKKLIAAHLPIARAAVDDALAAVFCVPETAEGAKP